MDFKEATAWAKIRDGLTLAAEGINEMLEQVCGQETASSREVDVAKIKWIPASWGKEAKASDNANNKDYEELRDAIEKKHRETGGKTYGLNAGKGEDMVFVWIMREDRNNPASKIIGLGAKKAQPRSK